jgi:probable rRNA maturation factor
MPMKIQIENRQTKFKIERKNIRNTVLNIFKILDFPDKEISIFLTDDENIKQLNKQYLGKNKATNVLSFSMKEGEYGNINPEIMGDIIISVETAQKDAVKGKLTVRQEIDFLLIHGILHLSGYNHENTSKEEAARMKHKEIELFNKLHGRHKTII